MKSDPVFVDEFLQDLIHHYSISNKDAMIQSDNAPMQYKNCYGFALLQKLANIFNLGVSALMGLRMF